MAKRTYRNDMPQIQRDRIAQANTGKRLSNETKAKISHLNHGNNQPVPTVTDRR